jgi:hypothetical protein
MENYASGDQRAATVSFSKNCFLIILPATARILREPPGADPHAGWCGGWGGDPPGYPMYARHGRKLMGCKSPVYEPGQCRETSIQTLAEGKGVAVR